MLIPLFLVDKVKREFQERLGWRADGCQSGWEVPCGRAAAGGSVGGGREEGTVSSEQTQGST